MSSASDTPRVYIGAYGLCRDPSGRLLLVRMASGLDQGRWTMPGGGIEWGEHPEAALLRELEEETGIADAEAIEVAEVYSHTYPKSVERPYDSVHHVGIVYNVTVSFLDLRFEQDGSTDRCEWCTENQARSLPLTAVGHSQLTWHGRRLSHAFCGEVKVPPNMQCSTSGFSLRARRKRQTSPSVSEIMEMKRTTIAAVAHNCSTGDSDKNLALMEEVLAGGETSETDIYVFPELNISGGVIKTDLVDFGETVPNGSHVEEVCYLAKRYRTAICAGLVESATDGMFLTHFIATPAGCAGSQRKLIPQPPTKAGPFKSGQVLTPIDLDGTRVAILACADFLLPEPSIAAALESIDLILSPTDSFAASMSSKLKTLQAARAMDCNAHVIAAFRIDAQTQSEQIAVIASDPEGRTLLHRTTSHPGTHVFRLDVDLQRTPPRWGGLPARVQLLEKMLRPYSC